jgi:hypothetical protein
MTYLHWRRYINAEGLNGSVTWRAREREGRGLPTELHGGGRRSFRIAAAVSPLTLTSFDVKERASSEAIVLAIPGEHMSHYVGPNGRLYKGERALGPWVALTIVALAVMAMVILGVPTIASGFRYLGL